MGERGREREGGRWYGTQSRQLLMNLPPEWEGEGGKKLSKAGEREREGERGTEGGREREGERGGRWYGTQSGQLLMIFPPGMGGRRREKAFEFDGNLKFQRRRSNGIIRVKT